MSFAAGEGNPRILHGFYCEVRFCAGKWAVDIRWKTGTETRAAVKISHGVR
jgi:hypothetical protein